MDLDDPLGIARQPVAKDDRIRASSDEDSAHRRRRRALGEDAEESDIGLGELDDDPFGPPASTWAPPATAPAPTELVARAAMLRW